MKLPSQPFYWSDFFAATEDMSDEAAKAYIFLLGHGWIRGAKLPNDDRALARMARLSPRGWAAVKADVLTKFELCEDGSLRQARMTRDHQQVMLRAKRNSENGSIGGQVTSQKKVNEIKEPVQATAQAYTRVPKPKLKPKEDSTQTSEGTLPFETEPRQNNSPSGDGANVLPFARPTPEPLVLTGEVPTPARTAGQAFEKFWEAYPRKVGKRDALKAFQKVAKEKRTTFEKLMEGLERYKKFKPTKLDYCHPATWLNGDRWDDHLEPSKLVTARAMDRSIDFCDLTPDEQIQRNRNW